MNQVIKSASIFPELEGWEERLERVLQRAVTLRSAEPPPTKDGRCPRGRIRPKKIWEIDPVTEDDHFSILFADVSVSGKDECWEWVGRRCSINGYGYAKFMGKNMHASRAAVMLRYGTGIIRLQYACHHCDNRACCNPYHLYLGTPRQNNMDTVLRGRFKKRRKKILTSSTEPVQDFSRMTSSSTVIAKRKISTIKELWEFLNAVSPEVRIECGTEDGVIVRLEVNDKTHEVRLTFNENF